MAKKAATRPAPARVQPTLGQATGGRPGRVPPARPAAAPRAGPLGLGLGLGPRQRGAFQQAAQQGQGQQWLAGRPGLQQRVNQQAPGGWRAQNLQNFLQGGQAQQRPPLGGGLPTPQPPTAGGILGGMGTGNPYMPPGGYGGGLQPLGGGQANLGAMYGGGGGMFNPMNRPAFAGPGGPMFGTPMGGMMAGFGGGGGGGGMLGQYSPAMQQILQARGLGAGGNLGGGLVPAGSMAQNFGAPQPQQAAGSIAQNFGAQQPQQPQQQGGTPV